MFRFIAALGRTFEVANSYGNLAVILQMILVRTRGGGQCPSGDVQKYMMGIQCRVKIWRAM